MRSALLVALLAVVTIASAQHTAPNPPAGDWQHLMWVDGTLTAIESIEVGMSRQDLEKLFTQEGGLHAITDGEVYIYKQCPYIKVSVQFASSGKIAKISRPYLERPTRAVD